MTDGRWELIRALGAVADSPAGARSVSPLLDLDVPEDAEHTEVFILNAPPYASVYLKACSRAARRVSHISQPKLPDSQPAKVRFGSGMQ